MLGDIVKVTPSSKAVGDMAIFMVQNGLTPENIYGRGKDIDFPDSIVSFFEGMMGQPEGGFPEKLQNLILKGKKPITCRPGELLEPVDFNAIKRKLKKDYKLEGNDKQVVSYALFEKVYEDYEKSIEKDGDFRIKMGSDIFFYGLSEGETCEVKIEEGKELIIKLIDAGEADDAGFRDVMFEVNGNHSVVRIKDKSAGVINTENIIIYAEENNDSEVGANISGNVVRILIKKGQKVKAKDPIAVIEAMKMETNILASKDGIIEEICVKEGTQVDTGELIAKIK